MKKVVCIVLIVVMILSVACSIAETNTNQASQFPSLNFNVEMPEFEAMDTSKWGDFDLPTGGTLPQMPDFDTSNFKISGDMPDGWGDMSLDGFSMPAMGDGWGNLGESSDWGSAFEEMKKKMETQEIGGSQPSESWPPESFRQLEDAFNKTKSENEPGNSAGMEDIKSVFSEKFGNVDTGTSELPVFDVGTLDIPGFTDQGNGFIGTVTGLINLDKISSFLANTMSVSNQGAEQSDMPSLGAINDKNLSGIFGSLKSTVKPLMDPEKKYDGSLFDKAGN